MVIDNWVDYVDEVEAALHFDERKFTFSDPKSQSTYGMTILEKNAES